MVIALLAGGFAINKIPALKQRVVEYINPAAKERRLIGELDKNLSDLDHAIAGVSGAKSDEERNQQIQKARDLINQAKNLQADIKESNDKNDGIISSNLTKIIDSFIDDTPYPADHLEITEELKAKICSE